MKNKILAPACISTLMLIAGASFARADLLIGKSYKLSAVETAFYCVGDPKERPHNNSITVFRATENDVFVYFGTDVGVKLDYRKIRSGGDHGSTDVVEGKLKFRDTAALTMSGDDVTLKVEAINLSGAGKYSAVWDFASRGTSCQPLNYLTPMLCGEKGIGTGYKNPKITGCEVKSGPPSSWASGQ